LAIPESSLSETSLFNDYVIGGNIMGRGHTFFDREFGRPDYDPNDQGSFEHGLVFVAMPFREEMMDVYSAITDECKKLGLKTIRVDENVGAGLIIREIIDFIERAEFIVFDLTYENPNVYYELGYAHGVGNEPLDILLIAKKGTKIPFDIAPFRIQFYKTTEHLRSLISSNLNDMILRTREERA
jgi:hypothetical protein